MRALIVGAGGQLGIDLTAACVAAGDDVIAVDRAALDVCDRGEVLGAVTSLRPDVVFNAAAWTAVDACEDDASRAIDVNGFAVRWLAEACDRVDAHLVQVSTDYVFDGALDRPYHEYDMPNPRSVYGASKLMGEREALVLGPSAAVVRTAWVCGEHGNNMVKTIVRLADERDELAFVDDQRGCPTFTADLALMLRRIALDRRGGVIHATNQGATTWFQFARDVVTAMGKDPGMVRPIATTDLQPPRPAPRPANSVLDNAALRAGGVPLMRDHHEPLTEVVRSLLA